MSDFAGWFHKPPMPNIGVRYTYGNGIEVYPDTIKKEKDTFNAETGIKAFINLAKNYAMGGGFSEYFNKLSPGLQENVIKRTQQSV